MAEKYNLLWGGIIPKKGRESMVATRKNLIHFIVLAMVLLLPMVAFAAGGERLIESGPVSLSLRGGGENNTAAMGIDGRVDYLNQLLNLHLFGTFDLLNGGNGEGEIDNTRYGAGIALSHTIARQVNLFAGTSFIRELNENFGHAYLGGKLKVADYLLLSATYGFGFGNVKEIQNLLAAEAADWLKAGVVLVNSQGWKANLYYYLTDPSDQKISGIEGELSYPILDNISVGFNGSCDLTDKSELERNWRSFLFVTYAFGGQKASPIDVALDKNNPTEYPRVIRAKAVTSGPVSTLAITPSSGSQLSCLSTQIKFFASGGVPPYSWSTNGGSISPATGTNATWIDTDCVPGGRTVTVTVTDAEGVSRQAVITLTPNSPT